MNQMGAFYSGTDDRDDNGNCTISGVVGKLNTTCEMVFRFNLPGNMKISNLSIGDIFAQEGETFDVPKEWLSQVKRQTQTLGAYGNLYGSGNTGIGGKYGSGNASTGGKYGFGGKEPAGLPARTTPSTQRSITKEQQEVLAAFGYPFALDEGEDYLPFVDRPLVQGRKPKKKTKSSGPSFGNRISGREK